MPIASFTRHVAANGAGASVYSWKSGSEDEKRLSGLILVTNNQTYLEPGFALGLLTDNHISSRDL